MKIVDLKRAKGDKTKRDAVKEKIANLRKQGEDVDMTLDEIRLELLELWDRVEMKNA